MNYIYQIKGFWILQEIHQLGVNEIALYFYLLEVNNKAEWKSHFRRNNYKVMADLGISSRKTLTSIKIKLQKAGVLSFKQDNGNANCAYVLNDLSNFYSGSGTGSGTGSGAGSGTVNKTKQKQNKNETFSFSGEENSPPPKKKKLEESKNLFWAKFIETFENFYSEKNNGIKYSYLSKDFSCLDKIYQFLKKRAEAKNFDWSEETMTKGFTYFLNKAYSDNWLQNHFSIPNLLSQFNQIANGTSTNGNANSRSGSVASAFAKIDSMPGLS